MNAGDSFLPHGLCYLWNSGLVWLHLVSDALIGLSYVAISAILTYLVYRARRDIPFHWVFLAFGVFIVACGATHFMEIWTLWTPSYWLAGDIKAITAVASVITALVLPPLVPKTVALVESAKLSDERQAKLEVAHRELHGLYARVTEVDRLKSEFFANVSHELRTPLTLIHGPVERLLREAPLSTDDRHALEIVHRNAHMLLKHVNDLLDIAKLDAGRMEAHAEPTDLAAVVRFVASHFDGLKEERQIVCTLELPDSLPMQTDREKCQRILFNLLSNAYKFIPDGGEVHCSLRQEEDVVVLDVADNGPGIPAEQQPWIFDRFRQGDGSSTRKFGGTGLGLAIVKEFATLLDGRVQVQDRPGGGTCFTVTLPFRSVDASLVPPLVSDARMQSDPAERPTHGLLSRGRPEAPCVLIVEDNADMADFLARALSAEYQTVVAHNGREGLDAAHALRPALILTDLMMPDVSGVQFIDACRTHAELSAIPIIVVTAKADDRVRDQLLKTHVHDYLQKPFSVDELLARVQRHLAESTRRRSAEQRVDRLLLEAEVRTKELRDNQGLLMQSAKMASLGTMAAGIAHELNNPLNNIGLYLQNALDQLSDDPPSHEGAVISVEKAAAQVDRAARIIRHLRAFTRRSTGQREQLAVRDLVYSGLELLQQPLRLEGVAVNVDVPLEAAIWGNRIELEQVIVNLLSNGLDAVRESTIKGISITATQRGLCVDVMFRDTGCGMASETLPRIFDPFFTTKPVGSGTGLGLSIVYGIVTDHGGDITVQSHPGKGTTFTLHLPTAEPSKSNPGTEASASGAAART